MIITKRTLPRRTFLRGAGATLALPLLDAMTPALAGISGKAPKPVRRLGWVYIPNGMAMQSWTPPAGAALELSPILSPLAPYRERMAVTSGLAQPQAEALGAGDDRPGGYTREDSLFFQELLCVVEGLPALHHDAGVQHRQV